MRTTFFGCRRDLERATKALPTIANIRAYHIEIINTENEAAQNDVSGR